MYHEICLIIYIIIRVFICVANGRGSVVVMIDFATLDLLSTLTNDGFIVVDSDHTVIYVNDKYCEFNQHTRENLLNKKVESIPYSRLGQTVEAAKTIIGEMYGVSAEDIRQALHEGTLAADENVGQIIDNSIFYISRAPIVCDGRVVGAIGIVKGKNESTNMNAALSDYIRNVKQELDYSRAILGMDVLGGISTLGYDSPYMQELKKTARKAAACDLPVLLTGETGTGKEVFANAIQNDSLRKDKPFIKVNCSAIPETLFESEFFGYEAGAFTGADKKTHKGKFEMADTGTIFLDEIGDLSLTNQAKLLRVLQEKSFERLGGSKPIRSDFRVIAATNFDLRTLVKQGKFRQDLYYRLNTIHIAIPPLREHPEDIPRLVRQILYDLNRKHNTYITVDDDVYGYLQSLDYEGNVRELKNLIERAYAMSEDSVLLPGHFKIDTGQVDKKTVSATQPARLSRLEFSEKAEIEHCLISVNYNCNRAAKILGISHATLYRKIKKYEIALNRPRKDV
jgi:transcriptional regulator with PAS, ATPase and Fis domain